MPQEWKISEHTISVIAKAICQSVSDISDIKFYGRGEGSLCYMISKILKKKCDNKSKLLYARLWEKNVHNLQDIVRNTFKEKINGSISCKPEESATSAEIVNSEDNPVKSNKENEDNPFKSNEEDEDNAVILNEH